MKSHETVKASGRQEPRGAERQVGDRQARASSGGLGILLPGARDRLKLKSCFSINDKSRSLRRKASKAPRHASVPLGASESPVAIAVRVSFRVLLLSPNRRGNGSPRRRERRWGRE